MENTNTVKNERLENLYLAARNARAISDEKAAIKHYEEISAMEPNSWEALFYLAILKTNTIQYGEIANAAIGVTNCLPKVFELIRTTIEDKQEQKQAVKEVVNQCSSTTAWLIKVNGNYFNALTQQKNISFNVFTAAMNMDSKRHARYESAQRMVNIGNIMCYCGNLVEKCFGMSDAYYRDMAVDCWKALLATHFEHIKAYQVAVFNDETIQKFAAKIRQYDAAYKVPQIKATEKRNYTIKGLLLVAAVLILTLLWYWWIWN